MLKEIDVPLLFRLWNDKDKTIGEVADQLGVSRGTLERLRRRFGLQRKEPVKKEREIKWIPTPQEIEQRAAEVRSRWTPEREYQARCRG
jgi:IS30 family transposase